MPEFVYTGNECREIDQLAMRQLQLCEMQLMERAGQAALTTLTSAWPSLRHIAVYCGPGNNGGDGYLVAAGARRLGYEVSLYALGTPASKTAQTARNQALDQGLEIQSISEGGQSCFEPRADLVVDALFGHGLERDIKAPLRTLIERINCSSTPVFALDMPSGINSDTGEKMGIALSAQATICFVAPKIGLLTGEGVNCAGEITYADLGIPKNISQNIPASYDWLDDQSLIDRLPQPRPSSHKGDFGHVAVVGGQAGMPGAVILAACAAARSGAGRVTAISSEQHINLIPQASPELMTVAIGADAAVNWPDSTTAIALGTGLGVEQMGGGINWSRTVFEHTLDQAIGAQLPLVVDADGLNLLAVDHIRYAHWVLSPHPREAAALLTCSIEEVESNRPRACLQIAQKYGGVCLLKGKGSLVAEASGRRAVCVQGNWGMATAGSGDVLSGIIAAFLGQGLSPYDAACAAVYTHACAGDLAAEKMSRRAMIASDIILQLPAVFKRLSV